MFKTLACVLALALLVALAGEQADAQVLRLGSVRPRPAAEVSTLSISATSPPGIQLVAKGISPSVAVSVTTTSGTCGSGCTVSAYAFFLSETAALSNGGVNIPSSAVLGQVSTGTPTAYTSFTQTGPFGGAGASLQLFQQAISSGSSGGVRTDELNLQVDLSSQPQLPAGTYTGTLYIQAQSL